MYKSSIFFFILAICSLYCEGKIFTRCGLVQELRRQGFPESQLGDWVCLVEKESTLDTSVVNKGMWGLFQLSQYVWCSAGSSPGNACNVRCADVATDDITKACACAKLVFQRQSFTAWSAWKTYCNGKELPDISKC